MSTAQGECTLGCAPWKGIQVPQGASLSTAFAASGWLPGQVLSPAALRHADDQELAGAAMRRDAGSRPAAAPKLWNAEMTSSFLPSSWLKPGLMVPP